MEVEKFKKTLQNQIILMENTDFSNFRKVYRQCSKGVLRKTRDQFDYLDLPMLPCDIKSVNPQNLMPYQKSLTLNSMRGKIVACRRRIEYFMRRQSEC